MTDLARTIVIDTETTGLGKDDEVISLAVIDGFGERIFYSLIMPTRRDSWPEAEAINGIGPEDVQGKPTMRELEPYLAPLLEQAELIIGYNTTFDLRMLRQSGLRFKRVGVYDVMRELADTYNDGRWMKLEEAAARFGFHHAGAHNALEDTKATLFLYWLLTGGLSHARFMRMACFEGVPAKQAAAQIERDERTSEGCAKACIWGVIAAVTLPIVVLATLLLR